MYLNNKKMSDIKQNSNCALNLPKIFPGGMQFVLTLKNTEKKREKNVFRMISHEFAKK
jgi:hypothetical protein